jgi:hypothetical protein
MSNNKEVFAENKEIIVCKFDSEIECTEYNCEYDCSDLETLELDGEESCPLFKREQLALLKVKALEAKIEAAKPILETIIAICKDKNDVTTCEECCDKKCCEEYELNALLFPRIDDQKSGESGPGVGDGSDPKNCPSLPIERRQPTSKTPRKEESSVELLHRYRNEYAEQGNEENITP